MKGSLTNVIDATPMALGFQHDGLKKTGAQLTLWYISCTIIMFLSVD